MLAEWQKKFPGRIESIATSISSVAPSHLMDATLFGFRGLSARGVADADGDIAFDEAPCGLGGHGLVGQVDVLPMVRHTIYEEAQP